jgi:hypothetical protein
MSTLFVSRHFRLSVLSAVLACVAATGACVEAPGSGAGESDPSEEIGTISSISTPQAKKLAEGLSRVLGATIRPQDLTVMPARQIQGIPPFSPLLDDRSGKWVVAEVPTPVGAGGFSAVVAAPSTWSEGVAITGMTAAVLVSSAAIRTCPTAVCALNSCITGMMTVPQDQGCPPLQCSSADDCDVGAGVTCMVNSCSDGQCTAQQVETQGAPCPPSECMSSFDCAGGTKQCTYKKCDGSECTSVTVTVNNSEPCPIDVCNSDNECGVGGGGGGIFDDIGY